MKFDRRLFLNRNFGPFTDSDFNFIGILWFCTLLLLRVLEVYLLVVPLLLLFTNSVIRLLMINWLFLLSSKSKLSIILRHVCINVSQEVRVKLKFNFRYCWLVIRSVTLDQLGYLCWCRNSMMAWVRCYRHTINYLNSMMLIEIHSQLCNFRSLLRS